MQASRILKHVDNPMLSVRNANLSKDTPVKVDASQKNPEYGRIQDIIAPPDLMHEGITSDVPICGQKTNILFHPIPLCRTSLHLPDWTTRLMLSVLPSLLLSSYSVGHLAANSLL